MVALISFVLVVSVLSILFYAGIPANSKEEKWAGQREYAFTPLRNSWNVALTLDKYPTLRLPRTAVPVDSKWTKDTLLDDANSSWWHGPELYFPALIQFKWGYKFYYARVWKNGEEWELDVHEDHVKNAPPKKMKEDYDDDFF